MLRQLRKIGRWLRGTTTAARRACRPCLETLEGRLTPASLSALPSGGAALVAHEAPVFTADGTLVPRGVHAADDGTLLSGAVVAALHDHAADAPDSQAQPPLPTAALEAALASLQTESTSYDVRDDLFAAGGDLPEDAVIIGTEAGISTVSGQGNESAHELGDSLDLFDPLGPDMPPHHPEEALAPTAPHQGHAAPPQAAEAAPSAWHYDFSVQSE